MRALHVVRDWRGLKHKFNEYSTPELIALLTGARHTQHQIEQFINQITGELVRRQGRTNRDAHATSAEPVDAGA